MIETSLVNWRRSGSENEASRTYRSPLVDPIVQMSDRGFKARRHKEIYNDVLAAKEESSARKSLTGKTRCGPDRLILIPSLTPTWKAPAICPHNYRTVPLETLASGAIQARLDSTVVLQMSFRAAEGAPPQMHLRQ